MFSLTRSYSLNDAVTLREIYRYRYGCFLSINTIQKDMKNNIHYIRPCRMHKVLIYASSILFIHPPFSVRYNKVKLRVEAAPMTSLESFHPMCILLFPHLLLRKKWSKLFSEHFHRIQNLLNEKTWFFLLLARFGQQLETYFF